MDHQKEKFNGIVYNFSVENSESYFANNILVHNCTCKLQRLPVGFGFDKEGKLSPTGKGGIEYEDENDLELSMSLEGDLQKAYTLAGFTEYQGLPIAIENKPGSVRHWKAPDGEGGETKMQHAYGYIRGTKGADNDEIDVFIGPNPKAENVYIVHQKCIKTGRYDEDKIILGASNREVAKRIYLANYDRPDFLIDISSMSMDHFKRWIKYTKEPIEEIKKGKPLQKLVVYDDLKKNKDKDVELRIYQNNKLKKAEVTAMIGASTSRALDRAPSPGTSSNYAMFVPVKTKAPVEPNRTLVEHEERDINPIKRYKKIYEVKHALHKKPVPLQKERENDIESKAELNREKLDMIHKKRIGKKNQVPVTKQNEEIESKES